MDASAAQHALTEDVSRAIAFHRAHPVIDGHADSILAVLDGRRTLVERSEIGHIDWPRAREAALCCTIQTAWPAIEFFGELPAHVQESINPMHHDPVRRIPQIIDRLLQQIEQAGDSIQLVRKAGDIAAAHASGRLAVLLNIEGAEAIGDDLSALRNFYRLGVRMMGLVWNFRNRVADGTAEEKNGGGLTEFGRAVVREMNRIGMVIDLAHIIARGFYDVLELSEHPVLFTHGNCRALWEHRRNLTDEQIKALAQKGGVFGISFVTAFMGSEQASIRVVADHIDHVVQLLGSVDYVGYGSDFDGASMPPDLSDVTKLPHLTAELMRRGYSEPDLQKIVGGNFLRVIEQVLSCQSLAIDC